MLRVALAIVIILSVKKPSLFGSYLICYSFEYGEEVSDTVESFIPSSLWQFTPENGLNLRPTSASKLLLILAGDVELCPGPSAKCYRS